MLQSIMESVSVVSVKIRGKKSHSDALVGLLTGENYRGHHKESTDNLEALLRFREHYKVS
jgi:hypothetical protein